MDEILAAIISAREGAEALAKELADFEEEYRACQASKEDSE